MAQQYRIAVIAGDGIGKEVVPEGIRVLDSAASKFGIRFQWDSFPWGCAYYLAHGEMMPEDGLDRIRDHDAVYLGAVGYPGVPDHISLWGLLIKIRRGFDQYANIRPVRLMPGVVSPLRGRSPGDIDFVVVRDGDPWFLVEVKSGDDQLVPELALFQERCGAAHAFQVVIDRPYVDADCFARRTPVVVPARTFLSQLL